MPLLPLITAVLLGTPTADAGPRRDAVHLQLQSGMLSRSSLRVDELDVSRQTTHAGLGAGGTAIAVGYHLRAAHEVGARLSFQQVRVDDDVVDHRRSEARLAGTYTRYWRIDKPLRATATGMLGLSRTNEDGDAQARAPFIGAGGGVHWFATPRTSFSTGLEVAQTLGGRYEQDGVEGSSRYSNTDVALVGGLNVYLGGRKPAKKARRRGRR
jgi:hypothetical protein